jgi:hypothetical protein
MYRNFAAPHSRKFGHTVRHHVVAIVGAAESGSVATRPTKIVAMRGQFGRCTPCYEPVTVAWASVATVGQQRAKLYAPLQHVEFPVVLAIGVGVGGG